MIAFDSNVLLYSLLEPTTMKGETALDIIERAALVTAIIPAQVLGEILAVVRRRRPALMELALATVGDLTTSFQVSPTDGGVIGRAGILAVRHRLQIWDAVICAASLQAGATHLLSEDMQDGAEIAGVRVINPFDAVNANIVNRLLPPLR